MGGAQHHRCLEIAAHAHAELAEAIAPGDLVQQGEMRRRFLIGRRNAHQAGDRELQVVAAEKSEEHTSELQSLMRISYAVFCLKKKKIKKTMRHADKN